MSGGDRFLLLLLSRISESFAVPDSVSKGPPSSSLSGSSEKVFLGLLRKGAFVDAAWRYVLDT